MDLKMLQQTFISWPKILYYLLNFFYVPVKKLEYCFDNAALNGVHRNKSPGECTRQVQSVAQKGQRRQRRVFQWSSGAGGWSRSDAFRNIHQLTALRIFLFRQLTVYCSPRVYLPDIENKTCSFCFKCIGLLFDLHAIRVNQYCNIVYNSSRMRVFVFSLS